MVLPFSMVFYKGTGIRMGEVLVTPTRILLLLALPSENFLLFPTFQKDAYRNRMGCGRRGIGVCRNGMECYRRVWESVGKGNTDKHQEVPKTSTGDGDIKSVSVSTGIQKNKRNENAVATGAAQFEPRCQAPDYAHGRRHSKVYPANSGRRCPDERRGSTGERHVLDASVRGGKHRNIQQQQRVAVQRPSQQVLATPPSPSPPPPFFVCVYYFADTRS
jgi:hypothetical protein